MFALSLCFTTKLLQDYPSPMLTGCLIWEVVLVDYSLYHLVTLLVHAMLFEISWAV